jgi:hypothetical protein
MADDVKMPAYEHEFGDAENQEFSKLSGAMKLVAITGYVFGILYVLSGIISLNTPFAATLTIGEGVVAILIATWLWSAAVSFRDIVVTEGNDLMNLMYAMRKLRKVYALQAWLFAIACILFVLLIFLLVGRSG